MLQKINKLTEIISNVEVFMYELEIRLCENIICFFGIFPKAKLYRRNFHTYPADFLKH